MTRFGPKSLRLGDSDYVIVSRWDVERVGSIDRARELAREVEPHAGNERTEVLAKELLHGHQVLIRLRKPTPVLEPPPMIDLRDLVEDEPTAPTVVPVRPKYWLQLRLVGTDGRPRAGASLVLTLPDGSSKSILLDAAGSWRADDLSAGGACELRLQSSGKPSAQHRIDDFEPDASMPHIEAHGPPVSLQTDQDHTVVLPVGASCVRLEGMSFSLNKAFLLPDALEGIRLLRHMYDAMPGAEVLVVGHTDRTGSASRNRSLSLQRAEAIVAFLRDDADAWLPYYDEETDYSRRWGEAEDIEMLSALPRDHDPHYGAHHEQHSYGAALRRFQEAHLLEPTGKADTATRRALIAEYMSMDETSLPEDAKIVAHGCGEAFPREATADGVVSEDNRRVEVFFFDDGIEPRPGSATSDAGAPHYQAWLDRVQQERTFRPSDAGLGTLRLITDIPSNDHEGLEITYILRSTDGAYEHRMHISEGDKSNPDIELHFERMPILAHYTLEVLEQNGDSTTVFEDVAYARLTTLSTGHEDELVGPFGWEEPTP